MPLTRLSVDGYGSRRAGSFAGRAEVIAVVVESNSGGYYIRLPDYRRKKRQQEESEPAQTVQTKRAAQTRQVIKPLFYADDTNQLSPYVPALFDVFAQRHVAQMEYRRIYNIRARAALLAA